MIYNTATQNKLLLHYGHVGNSAFDCCDTPELYELNLKRQPADWHYRTNSVDYLWNTNGYRAPEWTQVDWPASHIVMGCSFVAGIGVASKDTVAHQLAHMLGEPVVNLGYSAAGPSIIQFNSLRLVQADIVPKSVTIIVPEITRYTVFDAHNPRQLVPGILDFIDYPEHRKFYELYLAQELNSTLQGMMALDSARAMWASRQVPVYVYKYQQENPYPAEVLAITDYGRDLVPHRQSWLAHPGPKTYAQWAGKIFDKIRS